MDLPHPPSPRATLLRAAALLRAATADEQIHDLADWLASGAPPADLADVLNANPRWRRSTADRDRLIRQTAARLFPNWPIERTARTIHNRLVQYKDTEWQHTDCLAQDNPHPAGSLVHLLFELLKHRDHPLSTRQFEKIISRQS